MKKTITIISSICILLFIFAIAWFGAGLYIDKKNGIINADKRYGKLLNDTKLNFSLHEYGSSEFSLEFIKSIGNIDSFSTLKLEVNGVLVYSYPPSSFSLPSPGLVKSYSETVYSPGQTYTLSADIYLMNPGSIYNHSRFSFLLILAGTLLAGIFIIFVNSSNAQADEGTDDLGLKKIKTGKSFSSLSKINSTQVKTNQSEKEETLPFNDNSQPSSEEETISFSDSNEGNEYKPRFNPEEIFNNEELFTSDDTNNSEKDITLNQSQENTNEDPQQIEEEKIWNEDEIFSDEKIENNSTEDNSLDDTIVDSDDGLDIIDQFEMENQNFANEELFSDEKIGEIDFDDINSDAKSEISPEISPVTNLNIESSLESNLDNVLEETSPVTLTLVKINGLDRGNTLSDSIVSILKNGNDESQFFEYKSDAYAIILKNIDLQKAVDDFELLYNKITDFLKENNATNEVSAGISSDSGRKLKAERLILEADQALTYASQDQDSPIVAFRANPEKYREYEESHKN